MKKDVRDIRKSIAQRKKQREVSGEHQRTTTTAVSPVQDEEKFGYMPFSSSEVKGTLGENYFTAFLLRSIVAAVLFFIVAIVYQMDSQVLEKPKSVVQKAVTEEFQFASVNQWYQEKFGEPFAFLPTFPKATEQNSQTVATTGEDYALPVNGSIQESFQTNGQGILLATSQEAQVKASRDGTVLFAGNKEDTGKTIIIQHADGTKSYYGNLSKIDVEQYEQVSNGNAIGIMTPTTEGERAALYFAIQKGNQFIDPIQVIEVHDQP
ncbi:peptidoglycan DD-metalloendopeptidase family protein [Pontibacillus salicampi]|uniref:Peptidoglycan DD-metalloendopeptidase family protein n=1 Tax=Pontibacillus salicampi TaxID=1449801 RepID=A0ABV6LJ96_9BACI